MVLKATYFLLGVVGIPEYSKVSDLEIRDVLVFSFMSNFIKPDFVVDLVFICSSIFDVLDFTGKAIVVKLFTGLEVEVILFVVKNCTVLGEITVVFTIIGLAVVLEVEISFVAKIVVELTVKYLVSVLGVTENLMLTVELLTVVFKVFVVVLVIKVVVELTLLRRNGVEVKFEVLLNFGSVVVFVVEGVVTVIVIG